MSSAHVYAPYGCLTVQCSSTLVLCHLFCSELFCCFRLCELNVLRQVFHVATSPVVASAWAEGQEVHVYGVIYDLRDGHLKKLASPISENMVSREYTDRPQPNQQYSQRKKRSGCGWKKHCLESCTYIKLSGNIDNNL